jgi:hypothetical protein
MPTKRPPRDANELAKYVVNVTLGKTEKIEPPEKNPHAQALARLGASKGGTERAKRLSPTKRTLIAKRAAQARWKKKSE